ncbi:MAG: hypothetical protein JWR60_2772 [Polaromonas sp.]|nr:hypothetical protein [Polaromonas sp.]
MPDSNITESQLIDQFLETIQALPDMHAERNDQANEKLPGIRRCDAQIDVQIAGRSFTLLIKIQKTVYPRDVRQALWQLEQAVQISPKAQSGYESVSMLVAESISPSAKALLKDARVSYYDSSGSLFLLAPGVYLCIDKPETKILFKTVRSLFSGRCAQVLHTLLMRHQHWFKGKELAEQALVSPATASQVLTELERFDWTVSRGKGPSKERRLSEPAALLDTWVKQLALLRPALLRRYYVPFVKPEALPEHLALVFSTHEASYAISAEAAAQRYAPFLSSVSQVRTRLLVGPVADAAITALGARVVSEGANLVIIDAVLPGELILREHVGGLWLASPVQVYLDLLRGEDRAREMAEHLRKEWIGF